MQSSLFRKPSDSDDDESSSASEDISSPASAVSRDSAGLSSSPITAHPDNLSLDPSLPSASINPPSPSPSPPPHPITIYSPESPPFPPNHQYSIVFNALLESFVQSRISHPVAAEESFQNISRLLSDHGITPPNSESFARPELASVRQTYLDGVDALLQRSLQQGAGGEAEGHTVGVGQLSMVLRDNSPAVVPNPPTLKRVMTDSTPSGGSLDGRKVLQRCSSLSILANAAKAPKYRPNTAPSLAESPPSFLPTETQPQPTSSRINVIIKPSRYTSDFIELGFLGRGGFGSVFHVRNRLDGAEYAIKKVALQHEMFKKVQEGGIGAFERVVREVNTMARLEHQNIVRYYASWIDGLIAEQFAAGPTATGDVNVGASTQLDGIGISKNNSMNSDDLPHDENQAEVSEADIIFELDTDDSRVKTVDSTNGSKALSREVEINSKDSTDSTDGDSEENSGESVELIPRSFPPKLQLANQDSTSRRSSNYRGGKTATVSFKLASDDGSTDLNSESDLTESAFFSAGNGAMVKSTSKKHEKENKRPTSVVTLHIQMSLHQLGLTSYLSSAHPSHSGPKHCFCIISSLRLFSGLVDGVAYLHERDIVHRDLKPGNIFLDTYEGRARCKCSHTQNTLVVPRIGDFGLVKKVVEGTGTTSPSVTVGTEFYRPPSGVMDDDLIGRDLFALGVILVELIYRFDTRMERVHTLTALTRTGTLPVALDERIVDIVQGCCSLGPYVHKRWDLRRVKQAIIGIESSESQE